MEKKEFVSGDIVYYNDDEDKEEYVIYAVYSKNKVSLGLRDYPDTEQDYMTDIKDITKKQKEIKGDFMKKKKNKRITLHDGNYDETRVLSQLPICNNCGSEIEQCDNCAKEFTDDEIIYCNISEVDENKHLCAKCVERSKKRW